MLSFTPNQTTDSDTMSRVVGKVAEMLVIIGVSLLPILLIPVAGLTIISGKLFVLIACLSLALVMYAILLFRRGGMQWSMPLTLVALWSIVGVAVLSGALSGSVNQSLLGDTLGDGSAVSLGLLAFTATVLMIFARSTHAVKRLGVTFLTAVGALVVWHWVRIITGWNLTFGLLPGVVDTPLGVWSDLTLLLTTVVLAVLLIASQFTLSRNAGIALIVLLVGSLLLLMLSASDYVWMGLGVISLVTIAFTSLQRQSQQTMSMVPSTERSPMLLLVGGGIVFLISIVVILGGNTLQRTLVDVTGIDYVEVRPSVTASLDTIGAVLSDRPLLGTGPTTYGTAWRVHKDPAINQSIFWNTDFQNGFNTLMTAAVEIGILGLLAWVAFYVLFIISGIRTFLRAAADTQSYPYRVALVTYVVALIIWCALLLTSPSWGMVTMGAAATGAYLGLTSVLRPRRVFTLSLIQNQRASFVFVLILVVLVIANIALLSLLSRQIMAAAQFGTGVQAAQTGDIDAAREALARSYATKPTAAAAQAEALLRLQEMRQLVVLPEPTAAEQQQFQTATVAAVNAATAAVDLDPDAVEARYTLFAVFNTLAQIGTEGALDRATEVQQDLKARDPQSPEPPYLEAQLAVLRDDIEGARNALGESIRLKADYTPALYLAAQIEIAAGNVPEAIAVTRAILSFEPQNAARWYQLGVLFSAEESHELAVQALNEAVALDADYANALYVRALSNAVLGNTDAALTDLRRVDELNPDTPIVQQQISALESGDIPQVGDVPLIEENQTTEPGDEASDLVTGEDVSEDTADGAEVSEGTEETVETP